MNQYFPFFASLCFFFICWISFLWFPYLQLESPNRAILYLTYAIFLTTIVFLILSFEYYLNNLHVSDDEFKKRFKCEPYVNFDFVYDQEYEKRNNFVKFKEMQNSSDSLINLENLNTSELSEFFG